MKRAAEVSLAITVVAFTVDSLAATAGAAVADTTPSRAVVIRNKGGRSFEYKVDAGAWMLLGPYQTTRLDVDLSASTVTTRQSIEPGVADPTGQLEIEAETGSMMVGDDEFPIPGTSTRRQTGVDPVLIAAGDVAVSFSNTLVPAAKRSVVLPAARSDGRQVLLLPDGGDQAFTIDGNGKTVVSAFASAGAALVELATARAWTVMWSATLDKWVAW